MLGFLSKTTSGQIAAHGTKAFDVDQRNSPRTETARCKPAGGKMTTTTRMTTT
jgi:hypothetical protein